MPQRERQSPEGSRRAPLSVQGQTPGAEGSNPALQPSMVAGGAPLDDKPPREKPGESRRNSRNHESAIRIAREDAARRDTAASMERQRLLGLLEPPLISLLDRLGIRDDLSLALAQANVKSLTDLRNLDQENLTEALDLEDTVTATGRTDLNELCSLAIQSARRDLALLAIGKIRLQEDEYAVLPGSNLKQAEGKASTEAQASEKDREKDRFQFSKQVSNATEQERVRDGPLRQQLLEVTELWHDFLGTDPALGSKLANNQSATPSWKDTVAWAYWMLTSPLLHQKTRQNIKLIGKETIEKHLTHAKDHIWAALYPALNEIPRGEWRLYWIRVFRNFQGFFSEKGRQRWGELAAADARASAVRAGLKPEEQNAAASKAVAMVRSVLRSGPVRKRDPNSLERLTRRRSSEMRRGTSFPIQQPLWQHRFIAGNRCGASTVRAAISNQLLPTVPRIQTIPDSSASSPSPPSSRGTSQRSSRKGSVPGRRASTAPTSDRRTSVMARDSPEQVRRGSPLQASENVMVTTAEVTEDVDMAQTASESSFNASREEAAKAAREAIASQAASKHRGRYGAIAAAAAEAAAFIQQQQEARQRKNDEALKRAQAQAHQQQQASKSENLRQSSKDQKSLTVTLPEDNPQMYATAVDVDDRFQA